MQGDFFLRPVGVDAFGRNNKHRVDLPRFVKGSHRVDGKLTFARPHFQEERVVSGSPRFFEYLALVRVRLRLKVVHFFTSQLNLR